VLRFQHHNRDTPRRPSLILGKAGIDCHDLTPERLTLLAIRLTSADAFDPAASADGGSRLGLQVEPPGRITTHAGPAAMYCSPTVRRSPLRRPRVVSISTGIPLTEVPIRPPLNA